LRPANNVIPAAAQADMEAKKAMKVVVVPLGDVYFSLEVSIVCISPCDVLQK
jgi:hypothetical protein